MLHSFILSSGIISIQQSEPSLSTSASSISIMMMHLIMMTWCVCVSVWECDGGPVAGGVWGSSSSLLGKSTVLCTTAIYHLKWLRLGRYTCNLRQRIYDLLMMMTTMMLSKLFLLVVMMLMRMGTTTMVMLGCMTEWMNANLVGWLVGMYGNVIGASRFEYILVVVRMDGRSSTRSS